VRTMNARLRREEFFQSGAKNPEGIAMSNVFAAAVSYDASAEEALRMY
jgi:hypothetical protein